MIAVTELLQLGDPSTGHIPVDLVTASVEEAANAVDRGKTVAVPSEDVAVMVLAHFMSMKEAKERLDFVFRRNVNEKDPLIDG